MENKRSNIETTLATSAPNEAESTRPTVDAQEEAIRQTAAALASLTAQDALPDGFDLESAGADPDFWNLVEAYSAEAAVRIYAAEQRAGKAEETAQSRMDEQIKSRNALPRSTRAGISASPKPDFDGMSSEAFRAYEQQLKRASARGMRVPLS